MRIRGRKFSQVAVYGKATGGGGVATAFDPVHSSTNVTLSNGNLTATGGASANFDAATATVYKSSGLLYNEFTSVILASTVVVGIQNAAAPVVLDFPGNDLNGIGYVNDGRVLINGATVTTLATWTAGNVVSMAVDLVNSKIYFRVGAGGWNNDILAHQNPATNTGGISLSSLSAGPYTPTVSFGAPGDSITANFGATAYSQTPPTGSVNWQATADAAQTTAFLARTSGLTGADITNVKALINGAVSAGVFQLLDALWVRVTNNTTTAALNLCSTSFGITSTAAPAFTAYAGDTGNGTSQFLDTNFNPFTQGVNVTANSNSAFVYLGNARLSGSTQTDLGGGNNPPYIYLNALDSGILNTELNGATFPTFTLPAATTQGFTTVTRDATTISAYKNNSATALGTSADAAGALPNANMYLLAFNTAGTGAVNFAPDNMLAAGFAAHLTGAQHLALANLLNTYMTAYGKNAW